MERRLDHVGLIVSDLARARRFYEDELGLALVGAGEDEAFRMLTLRRDQLEVHLFEARGRSEPARIDHLALSVTPRELERALEDLRRRGVPFSGPHRFEDTTFVKLRDPDGLVWELTAHDARA